MADEKEKTGNEAGSKAATESKELTRPRRYKWHGIEPRNPKVFNLYGTLKLRPWAMNDEEIDATIKLRPDLARLWTKVTA